MKRIWTTPKRGLMPAENEDAVATRGGILAVADGATEAFASRVWARLLVEHLTALPPAAAADPAVWFWERVDAARAAWDAWRGTQIFDWLEEQAAARGSAAAVAVLLLEPRGGQVRGLAIGDVTVVRLRPDASPFVWPLTMSAEFGNRPPLVGARVTPRREVAGFTARYEPGDQWLLLTDALAAWALRCAEADAPIWADLAALSSEEAWRAFVVTAREAGMKNDDTTLLVWQGRRQHRAAAPLREEASG